MTTDITVYWDDQMLDHEPPKGPSNSPLHPLSRSLKYTRTVVNASRTSGRCLTMPSVTSSRPSRRTRQARKAIERVHDPDYLDWLVEFCADGGGRIEEDTTTGLNEHTYDAARVSARAAAIAAAGRDKRLTGRKTMGKRRSPMRCVAPAATTPSPIAQTDSVTSTTSRSQRRLRSLLTDRPTSQPTGLR